MYTLSCDMYVCNVGTSIQSSKQTLFPAQTFKQTCSHRHPAVLTFFCVQLDAFLLDLFWLHNPFSRCWGDKQTCSKNLNFARKLLDWLVPSAALRIFVAMILYELQLDAGAASKAIHHESLGCDSFFKPGGLWLRYHDLHFTSWIIMNHDVIDVFYPHHSTKRVSNTVSHDDARYIPDSTLYEVQFWDHCCHRYCTKFVPHRVQRWYASFSLLGPAGMSLTEVRQRRLQASWNEGGVVVRINSCLRGNSWQVSSFSTWSVLGDIDRYWYCSLGGGFKS